MKLFLTTWVEKLRRLFLDMLPSRSALLDGLRMFAYIVFGSLLISPLVSWLPLLGFDWYFFFNSGSPVHNLHSNLSFYPPFARLFIDPLLVLPWRQSLLLLSGITIMSIALGCWRAGGRYGSIALSLINAPVFFLLWIGHPDGLTLIGVLTGFIPFMLIKPQIAIWSIFADRKKIFWTGVILFASLFIWPMWFMNLVKATVYHEPAFGWPVTGWPILVIGLLFLVGAGKNPWRLMAAGTLVTPYLLPYHLAILTPGIGSARGFRKIIIWFSAWLVMLGTGLGGPFLYLNFALPVTMYLLTGSFADYKQNVANLWKEIVEAYDWVGLPRLPFLNPNQTMGMARKTDV